MNKLFWPVITHRNGIIDSKLSTSTPFHSLKEARDQISLWAQDFHILSARVDVYDGSVFPVRKIRTYNFF